MRRMGWMAAATALALVGGLGAAVPAQARTRPRDDAPTTYKACANKDSGAIRLVVKGKKCKKNEIKLEWNVQGPAGMAGPVGPQGPAGATGPQGLPGSTGAAGPSWATAGITNMGGDADLDLTGFTPGAAQTFTTADAGPVLIGSTQFIDFRCSGPDGPNYSCNMIRALAVDGRTVAGTPSGLTAFDPVDLLHDELMTVFGVVPNLAAGTHEIRLYIKTTGAGGAIPSASSMPWSFFVLRVGSVSEGIGE